MDLIYRPKPCILVKCNIGFPWNGKYWKINSVSLKEYRKLFRDTTKMANVEVE